MSTPTETTWLDGPADRQFVMPQVNQGEWTFTARDVLDTTAPPLDYSYDDETLPVVERRADTAPEPARALELRGRRAGKRGRR